MACMEGGSPIHSGGFAWVGNVDHHPKTWLKSGAWPRRPRQGRKEWAF